MRGPRPPPSSWGNRDPILALGAIVGRELYGTVVPIVVADRAAFATLRTWTRVRVDGTTVVPAHG